MWYLVSYFAKGSLLQFVSYLVVRDVKAQNVMRDSTRLLVASLGSDLCAVSYVSATQSWRVAGGRYAATGWFTRDFTSAERYHSPYGNAHSQSVYGLLCGRFLRGERKQLVAVSSTTVRHAFTPLLSLFRAHGPVDLRSYKAATLALWRQETVRDEGAVPWRLYQV
jgi:hypothetical protein